MIDNSARRVPPVAPARDQLREDRPVVLRAKRGSACFRHLSLIICICNGLCLLGCCLYLLVFSQDVCFRRTRAAHVCSRWPEKGRESGLKACWGAS